MNRGRKYSVPLLLGMAILALFSAPGLLQAEPCNADVETFCGDKQPGMGAVADCLQVNMDKLSYACRERLSKLDRSLRDKATACSSDARNFCRDVKPGYGRVKNCLLSNLDKLSNDCREALK